MKDRSSPNLLYSLFVSILIIIPIFLFTVSVISAHRTHAAVSEPPYSYWYHDERIVMTPSEFLIALKHSPSALSFAAAQNLQRDPLSDRDTLRSQGITLYRTTTTPPSRQAMQLPAWTLVGDARSAGILAQPVFHSGDFLQIPTDEVIVAFQRETTVEEARSFLNAWMGETDLRDLRFLRRNTFIAQIGAAANGRAFAVSRDLTAVPGIAFAEPNFLMVRQKPDPRILPDNKLNLDFDSTFFSPLEAEDGFVGGPTLAEPKAAPVGWTTVLSEGFESTVSGWTTAVVSGAVDAVPVIQTFRKRSGNAAVYMTGGGSAGVPAPGPYPNDANVYLFSPPLDLSPYQEAYAELWFYAKYEADPWWDYGVIYVYDSAVGDIGYYLAISSTGDLTADPTTENGWRKVLVRIPPALRTSKVQLVIEFFSDAIFNAEGLYIDDVRVVGTTNVDTAPLGNDPYGARHYEFENSGQIAGLGGAGKDLNLPAAWEHVTISDQVVVAVIDGGVQLNHPDLNLVTGYDADTGAVGGGPRDDQDAHGTACAGNVGAIRNNAQGVIGAAPGVKIMPIYWGITLTDLATAFDLAVANGATVLSNSWALGSPSSVIEAAIGDALAAGRTVLFAAGNGPDRPPYTYQTAFPCNLTATTNVICVGASSPTDEHKGAASSDGEFYWGSSYIGAGPDVVAPGPWSYTTDLLGSAGYNQSAADTGVDPDYMHDFSGTSSSTPKVAGIVALMLSKNPTLSPQEAKTILRQTAHDIGDPGVDERTGAGRVDAYAAVMFGTCPELVLQNRTVTGTETHAECRITAGPAFVVTATGNATLRAGERITLRPGFQVRAGGRFQARMDPSLRP